MMTFCRRLRDSGIPHVVCRGGIRACHLSKKKGGVWRRRVPESEKLHHKVMLALNDEQYAILQAEDRGLSVSTVARLVFAEALPEVRRKRLAVRRQVNYAKRKAKGDK